MSGQQLILPEDLMKSKKENLLLLNQTVYGTQENRLFPAQKSQQRPSLQTLKLSELLSEL